MARLGCCGSSRPLPLAALIARADAYPASSPKGRAARARLAYTIAAHKASQAGNGYALERALAGLRGVDLADGPTLTTHGTVDAQAATDAAVAAAPQIRATLSSLVSTFGSSGASAALTQASAYISIVLGFVNVGTGIGAAAGGDANAIRVVNMIVSWIRTLLTGSTPTIPDLDANTIRGLIAFCQFKDLVNGMIGSAIGAGSAYAGQQRDANAVTALATIGAWLTGIVDGICNISQVRTAMAAQSEAARAAALCARTPNSRINPTSGLCECAPGFTPGGTPDASGSYQCVPGGSPSSSGPIMLTAAQRRALTARPGTLTPAQQSLVNAIPVTLIPGTLDPVTLCAPGETPNPCSGICDGGNYRSLTRCVNGVPTKASSNAVWALPAIALAWYFVK